MQLYIKTKKYNKPLTISYHYINLYSVLKTYEKQVKLKERYFEIEQNQSKKEDNSN